MTTPKDAQQIRNTERMSRFAIPTTFGFFVLLIAIEIYGFGQIPHEMMISSLAATVEIIIGISVVVSLVVFVLTFMLVKILREKTKQLQIQNDGLEIIIKQKTEELLRTERLVAIGQLSARIAHDIRNPLTIIMNAFEIIRMKSTTDCKTEQHYDRINKAVMRITHQIDDVMDFVKDNPIIVKKCLFSDIITEVLESTKIPDKIKLRIYDSDISLDCDFNKIVAVFKNLILNAVQAINDEGKISIRILDRNGIITIEIEDSGPKIPEAIVPRIFEPLFTTKQEGTGLGLSICKNIIEKHGGTIIIRNNEHFGKIFSITLPKMPIIIVNPISEANVS